jgi:predicted Rossmann-fold nucleotide-binding protein
VARPEIERIEDFAALVEGQSPLRGAVVTGLDLRRRSTLLSSAQVAGCVFLGCRMSPVQAVDLIARRALVFPTVPDLPFDPWRRRLYHPDDLYPSGDAAIYAWWIAQHQRDDLFSTLMQRIHDHSIEDALSELIVGRDIVGIMGGHALARGDDGYAQIASLGRALTEAGFLVATGGGPGAMEAANLGASLAGRGDADLSRALSRLAKTPGFRGSRATLRRWVTAGLRTRAAFPAESGVVTIGVPTWFYGHEPTNPFATHIAKYFANSVREDGLLTIANAGVIFAPGRAGTVQEVFQDATQNYYVDRIEAAPMILFGKDYWTRELPVWPLLERLFDGRDARPLISTADDPERIVKTLTERRFAVSDSK